MLGGTPGWKPPGAQGQPGDTTEVDQSIVQKASPPHKHPSLPIPTTSSVPPATRCHLYVGEEEPRLYRASSCLYFLSASPASCPLCWGSEKAAPPPAAPARPTPFHSHQYLRCRYTNRPRPGLIGIFRGLVFLTCAPDAAVSVSMMPASLHAQPCTDAWMVQRYNFLGNVT